MPLLLHVISAAELTPYQHDKLTKLGLSIYSHAGLSALVTACKVTDVAAADRDSLLTYSQLIETTRAITDIIPMRYGTVMDDEKTLYQALSRNRERFSRKLQTISGCVEMSIRLSLNPATIPSTALSGQAYLQTKQQNLCNSQVVIKQITDSVAGYYVDSKADYAVSSGLLRVYFLVKNAELEQLQRANRLLKLLKFCVFHQKVNP